MKDIPFFYYDIVARIFPGGVVIALLAFTVPEMRRFISGPESWKTATIPLAFIGLSYMIGVLFEVLFTDWLVWRWIGDITFKAAASEHRWPENVTSPNINSRDECRAFREEAWFDLVLAGKKDRAQGFPHALRFWAEAKMCMHTFLPVLVAAIILFCKQRLLLGACTTVAAGILLLGVYSRDKRKWIQVLHSSHRLGLQTPNRT